MELFMRVVIIWFLVVFGFSAWCLAEADAVKVAIDPGAVYQTVEGFGHGNMEQYTPVWYHKYGPAGVERILDSLYTLKGGGLGLNIYRYPMPAADAVGHDHMSRLPKNANKAFEYEDGKFNWQGHEDVLWMGKGAVKRNAKLWASWYGIPYWLSVSGCSSGSADGKSDNLIAGKEKRFIRHAIDIMKHFRDEWQMEFDWVNPINEPEADWWKVGGGQPGSGVSSGQAIILYDELDRALKANAFDAKIVAYDAAYTNTTGYLDVLLGSGVRGKIDVLACHQYVTSDAGLKAWADRAKKNNKGLWMSEWGDWTNTKRTAESNMKQMMNYANKLHEAFDVLGANAWIMWEAGFIFDGNESGLGRRKSYWAVAHYSRHVREGFKRIGVVSRSDSVKTTAWVNRASGAKKGRLVVVTVNDGEKGCAVEYDLSGFESPVVSEIRRTSADEDYRLVPAVVKGSSLLLKVPGKSVTTISVEFK